MKNIDVELRNFETVANQILRHISGTTTIEQIARDMRLPSDDVSACCDWLAHKKVLQRKRVGTWWLDEVYK